MLLLIDIFSINKGRWYENPSLEIIVTECCSNGGCPLKEACEHYFLNQSAISIVVLMSCVILEIMLVILLLFFHFQHFIYVLHIYYIQYLASGIRALSLAEIVGIFFSRLETYSSIFKPQRSVITCINPQLRDSYTQEIQVVLKHTSVGHPCNPCWYPFEWQRIRQHLCMDRPRFP